MAVESRARRPWPHHQLRGTVQDITERKRAEEALALFKRWIDGALQMAPIGRMPTTDSYTSMTQAAQIWVTRVEKMIGKSILDISPEASPEGLKRLWESLRSQGFVSKQSVHRRKDGSEYPVDLVITYVQFASRGIRLRLRPRHHRAPAGRRAAAETIARRPAKARRAW